MAKNKYEIGQIIEFLEPDFNNVEFRAIITNICEKNLWIYYEVLPGYSETKTHNPECFYVGGFWERTSVRILTPATKASKILYASKD